jgi:ribosomal protein S18 acetylase RimI-like enzyme
METKIFKDKKIIIRKVDKSDLKRVKDFQKFINALVQEEAKILWKEKVNAKTEKEFLERLIKSVKNKKKVYLLAQDGDKMIGSASIELLAQRKDHIAKFGISISDGYRGMGLGKYLMGEIIKLAKKELDPKPKIIQLEVYSNNKPAIALYKKMGFKQVAKIPKGIQHKGKLVDEFVMFLYV